MIVYPVFCVQGFSCPLILGQQIKNKINIKIKNWYNTSRLLKNAVKLVHPSFQLSEQMVSWCKKNKMQYLLCVMVFSARDNTIHHTQILKHHRTGIEYETKMYKSYPMTELSGQNT